MIVNWKVPHNGKKDGAITSDRFGTFYEVQGILRGVNGINLGVVTIWLHQSVDSNFCFITLVPD
jgi:hypothetical protein